MTHKLANTLFAIVIFGSSPIVSADNDIDINKTNTEKALSYYRQAEILFDQKKYTAAASLYKKALESHSTDEKILVKKIIRQRATAFGRSAKSSTVDLSERVEYQPNRRLTFITRYQDEQNRRAHPPALELNWITLREPTHDNVLDGGETAAIVLEIINTGKSGAMDVELSATVNDHQGLSFPASQMTGSIAANESKTVELKISADKLVTTSSRNFLVTAKEKTGFDSNTIDITINTHTHQPESIVVTEPVIHDFNDNQRIEPSEMIDVKTGIKNIGNGVSKKLVATIVLGQHVFLDPDSTQRIELGEIYPGEERPVSFSFITNRRLKHNKKIPVALVLTDEQGTAVINKQFDFTVYAPNNLTQISIAPIQRPSILPKAEIAVDVDINIPARKQTDPYAVAVVIGNKNYQTPGIPPVKYAHNDAAIMKQYFMNTLGVAENNILYLEDATSAKFNEAFGSSENYAGWLYNFIEPGKSRVYIYYSGHGAPDLKTKSSYFVPTDANPVYLANSGYSLNTFYKNLAKLPAKNITVVLDTCFSGNSDGGFLFNNISPVFIHSFMPEPSLNNTAVFSSSEGSQVSTWYNEKRHGLFTYYFLKGLQGEADSNNDQRITTTELNDFIGTRLPFKARRINGNEQTPSLKQNREYTLVDFNEQKIIPVAKAE